MNNSLYTLSMRTYRQGWFDSDWLADCWCEGSPVQFGMTTAHSNSYVQTQVSKLALAARQLNAQEESCRGACRIDNKAGVVHLFELSGPAPSPVGVCRIDWAILAGSSMVDRSGAHNHRNAKSGFDSRPAIHSIYGGAKMSSIRCRLGFHDWTKFGYPKNCYGKLFQFRQCQRCGIVNSKQIRQELVTSEKVNESLDEIKRE